MYKDLWTINKINDEIIGTSSIRTNIENNENTKTTVWPYWLYNNSK